MKIRDGFVSNSSSSSFIVNDKKELEQLKNFNVSTIKVLDLINDLELFDETIEKNFSKDGPFGFLNELLDLPDLKHEIGYLKDLESKHPGCMITSPIDRDDAYNQHVNLEVYESDL